MACTELSVEKAANSGCVVLRSRSKRWLTAKVTLRTIFKVNTELRSDIRGERLTIHEFSYPEVGYERFYCIFQKLDVHSRKHTWCSINNSDSDPWFLKQRPLSLKDFEGMLLEWNNLYNLLTWRSFSYNFIWVFVHYSHFTTNCNENKNMKGTFCQENLTGQRVNLSWE